MKQEINKGKFKICLILVIAGVYSQPFDGLTLLTNGSGDSDVTETHLIDNSHSIINSWFHDTNPSSVAYLSPDSILFVACKQNNSGNGPQINGRFKKMDWNGNIVWDYNLSDDLCRPHHDIAVLPNGNILAICSEVKTREELENAGMIIEGDPDINLARGNMDMVIEIEPVGIDEANIVWKWHFWDHLIQDIDSQLPNYGNIAENPQLLDINSSTFNNGTPGENAGDWMHCNSIFYNPELDQIVLSSRHRSELYIIDHSTTTEEAATHVGGLYGRGGDFLYRWGNPQNYGRGTETDQILNGQHSVNWIPSGYPGEGNIILFNNFHSPNSSSILEIITPINEDGTYFIDNYNSYGPDSWHWIFQSSFYSAVQSGTVRLPNGNTLITSFEEMSVFEINSAGEVVWTYQGNIVPRIAIKYPYNYFHSDNVEILNIDYIFHDGWNLVGLPVIIDNTNYHLIFPESLEGTLYSFNDGYIQESEFLYGYGYWLRFESSGNVTVTGNSINQLTIELNQGWNLISGISSEFILEDVDDSENLIIPGTVYGFENGYVQSNSLQPGNGYWLRASGPGFITLNQN